MNVTSVAMRSGAAAQEPPDICADRCIRVEEVTRLGAIDDPVSTVVMPWVRWIGDRWWVIDVMLPHTILHYDRQGAFMGRIDREGEGPGEFGWIRSATPWAGDSALVSEESRRVHIVSPDGSARWVGRFGTGIGLTRLSNNRLLAPGPGPSPSTAGYPLHLYAEDGTHLKSFGTDQPGMVRSHRSGMIRVVEPVAGGFWAVQPDRYELEYWSNEGRLLDVVRIDEDWFPPRTVDVEGWNDARPQPTIYGIQDDGEHLWVLMHVADPDWSLPRPGESRPTSASTFTELRDGLIDVISKATGEVVARVRTDAPLFGFAHDLVPYSTNETDSGLVQIVLWSLALTTEGEDL